MLSKKLKFDKDVLIVIREMVWSEDGRIGKINSGQLDRQLYVRVNKALELMGGTWSRKDAGHVFQLDPRDQVEGLLQDGSLTVTKDGFFETPLPVIAQMFRLLEPAGWVLEPSAGLGRIAGQLLKHYIRNLTLVEKDERRAEYLEENFGQPGKVEVWNRDFMDCDLKTFVMPMGFDRIYMNPPFEQGQDVEHVRHAYELLAEGGGLVSVMSEHPFFAQDKRSVWFRGWFADVNGMFYFLPEGSFHESGTDVKARLVVIMR